MSDQTDITDATDTTTTEAPASTGPEFTDEYFDRLHAAQERAKARAAKPANPLLGKPPAPKPAAPAAPSDDYGKQLMQLLYVEKLEQRQAAQAAAKAAMPQPGASNQIDAAIQRLPENERTPQRIQEIARAQLKNTRIAPDFGGRWSSREQDRVDAALRNKR